MPGLGRASRVVLSVARATKWTSPHAGAVPRIRVVRERLEVLTREHLPDLLHLILI